MTKPVEQEIFNFSDIVLVSHRVWGKKERTWSIHCPDCGSDHMFRKTGGKVWHTSCWKTGTEWTITPSEYFVQRSLDLKSIFGEGQDVDSDYV